MVELIYWTGIVVMVVCFTIEYYSRNDDDDYR